MPKKGNWIVKIKATVTKDVFCVKCTKQQANEDPFAYAAGEEQTGMSNFDVLSVESND
jgi:hypothetical protein